MDTNGAVQFYYSYLDYDLNKQTWENWGSASYTAYCWAQENQLIYSPVLFSILLPHPKEILLVMREKKKKGKGRRNLSVLHYFPGLSIHSSLPLGKLLDPYFILKELHLYLIPSKGWCHRPRGPYWDLELAMLQGRAAPGLLGSLCGQQSHMLLPVASLLLANPPSSPSSFPWSWKLYRITVPVPLKSRTPLKAFQQIALLLSTDSSSCIKLWVILWRLAWSSLAFDHHWHVPHGARWVEELPECSGRSSHFLITIHSRSCSLLCGWGVRTSVCFTCTTARHHWEKRTKRERGTVNKEKGKKAVARHWWARQVSFTLLHR